MFGLTGIKLIALGLAGLFIVSAVSGGYLYLTHLENLAIEAKTQAQQLADAKAIQDDTIKQLQDNGAEMVRQVQANQDALTRLSAGTAATQADVDRLAGTLSKHNLRSLTDAKPNLMAGHLNHGTGLALDRLRQASRPAHSGDDKIGGAAQAPIIPPAPAGTTGH